MADIFLSYASADLPLAERLHVRLVEAGFSVWFDKARLRPGHQWHEEIEQHCAASRVVLPLLTPRWKASQWTRFETYAHDSVVPVVAEGQFLVTKPDGTIDEIESVSTPPLRRFQAHSLGEGERSQAAWAALVEALRAELARPAPVAAARATRFQIGHTEYFVGRESTLNDLHEKLWVAPMATLSQGRVQALADLGGIGKSTVARAYAEQFWRLYPQAFWVDCRLSLVSEFAALFDLLFPDRATADIPPDDKARLALAELNQSDRRPRRLLILDDAADEDAILAWIPRTGTCHTIITSRFTAWSNVPRCEIWVLDAEASRRLLLSRKGQSFGSLAPAEQAACDELAARLGYLPLALEQAAAYVAQPGSACTFAEYLRRFESAERYFLEHLVSRGSTNYPASVFATWRTTIDRLPAESRALLRLSSFLAPAPIPEALWTRSPEVVRDRATAMADAGVAALQWAALPDELMVHEALAALASYALVRMGEPGAVTTFSVHDLVQTVERHDAAQAEQDGCVHGCVVAHKAVAPPAWNNPSGWPMWTALEPHVESLADRLVDAGADAEAASLWNDCATFRHSQGRYGEAEPLFRRALAARERVLGAEHPSTLTSVNNLACLYRDQGRYGEAEPLFRRALAARERVLGAEHPDTLTSVNSLACLYHSQGRYGEAEPLFRRALAARERVLGAEHPDTLTSVNNLACLYRDQGRYGEAEPLFRRALAARERVLGVEHPDTLTSVGNLAFLYQSQGRYGEAEPLYQRALAACERVLGAEHPNTLTSVNSLAILYQSQGRYGEAEPLFRWALAACERVLGPEHPNTLTSVNNLAILYESQGRYGEAEPLYQRALAARERVLGAEHPKTLTSVNNLAGLYESQGRYGEAEPLYQRALAACERVLGAEHPNTLISVNNLAFLYESQGRYGEAEPLFRRALAGLEEALGAEHPSTKAVRRNLAGVLSKLAGE